MATPEELAQLLQYGQQTSQLGMANAQAPRHWAQALAGALQMGIGGQAQRSAAQQEGQGRAEANQMLAQLLSGQGDPQAAMANPYAAKEARAWQAEAPQREMQQFRMAQERQMAPLNMDLKRAQIDAAKARAASARDGMGRYGKAGQIFHDPKSNQWFSVQFSSDGTRKIEPLNPGMVPANLSPQAAADKTTAVEEAKAGVKGRQALPKVTGAYKSAEVADRNLFRSLKMAEDMASAYTTGFLGAITSNIPGTDASNLRITLEQIKANMGFAELQQMRDNSPTGGALGNVTERELSLLTNAQVALDQAQTKDQFLDAIRYIRQIKQEYAELRRQAYEADVARYGAAAVPNPETGQAAPATPAQPQAQQGWGIRRLD